MDLDERKLRILAAVVDNYVMMGEPVSSKTICESLNFSISSATVRNEMASLTILGLLDQPHTSSGRIPSHLGYRVYINRIMNKRPMSISEQKKIDDVLFSSVKDPDNLLKGASEVLADMTKCVVASVMPPQDDVTIRNIQLIKISCHSAIVILVTSTGIIRNRICCCDFDLNHELVNIFQRVLQENFLDVSVLDVNPAFIQTAAASLGEFAIIMSPVLMAVLESAQDVGEIGVKLEGELNLLFVPEINHESIHKVFNFLSNGEGMADLLLHKSNRNIQVLVGPEIQIKELKNLSVIISRYSISSDSSGAIGIIGPMRMDYAKFLSSIEYISDILGKILREIINY